MTSVLAGLPYELRVKAEKALLHTDYNVCAALTTALVVGGYVFPYADFPQVETGDACLQLVKIYASEGRYAVYVVWYDSSTRDAACFKFATTEDARPVFNGIKAGMKQGK